MVVVVGVVVVVVLVSKMSVDGSLTPSSTADEVISTQHISELRLKMP